MANTVLAMQGGAATSIGATFDGQPMQKGVHPTVENPNSALGHSCAKAVQPASTHPSVRKQQTVSTSTVRMQRGFSWPTGQTERYWPCSAQNVGNVGSKPRETSRCPSSWSPRRPPVD